MTPQGYVFDAYGTLFDVHSVIEAGRAAHRRSRRPLAGVAAALARLHGCPRAILSNGAPRMLTAAVASAGLDGLLEHVISVDEVKTYKPAPQVYALGPRRLGLPVGDLLFVSSNAWDVAGAAAFGYRTAWCNRLGAPEERLGGRADVVIASLDELPR